MNGIETGDRHPVTIGPRTVRAVLPLLVAALLAVAAVLTVDRAGCDTPGRYVTTSSGVELLGGCVAPGALPAGQLGDERG